MIKKKIPLAGQNVFQPRLRDQMVVALEPLVALLPYKGSVVSSLEGALVINNREEGVSIIAKSRIFSIFRQAIDYGAVVIAVAPMRHERGHVQLLREGYERRNLLVLNARMLESLQMKTGNNRQLLHRQLLRTLLVGLTIVTFNFCA